MRTRDTQGFTLIELLIAVVIIGILAALVIPQIGAVQERAYEAAMKNTLKNIVNMQVSHLEANNVYGDLEALETMGFAEDTNVNIGASDIVAYTSYGFTASVSHSRTDMECVLQYGRAGAAGAVYTGETVCAVPGTPAPPPEP